MGDVCDAASRNETASLSEESEDTVIVSFVINIGIGEGIEGAAALTCARDGGDVTPSPHFGNKDDTAWEGGERSIGIGGAAALTCARDGGDVTPSPHFGSKDDTAWEGGERSIVG